jgi:mono/diheme cytochrome c family protein
VKYILPAATLAAASLCAQIPWEKNRGREGQALYRENCVVCHEVEKPDSKKFGPSFYQLFKKEKMPLSPMKPNRQYIAVRVKFGGKLMPAFQKKLTDAQINLLIDYLEQR